MPAVGLPPKQQEERRAALKKRKEKRPGNSNGKNTKGRGYRVEGKRQASTSEYVSPRGKPKKTETKEEHANEFMGLDSVKESRSGKGNASGGSTITDSKSKNAVDVVPTPKSEKRNWAKTFIKGKEGGEAKAKSEDKGDKEHANEFMGLDSAPAEKAKAKVKVTSMKISDEPYFKNTPKGKMAKREYKIRVRSRGKNPAALTSVEKGRLAKAARRKAVDAYDSK